MSPVLSHIHNDKSQIVKRMEKFTCHTKDHEFHRDSITLSICIPLALNSNWHVSEAKKDNTH